MKVVFIKGMNLWNGFDNEISVYLYFDMQNGTKFICNGF